MRKVFDEIIEELEIEINWAKTHGSDKSCRDGRVSGLATAMRIIKRIVNKYCKEGKDE